MVKCNLPKNLSSLKLRHLDKLREIPELGELEYLDIAHYKSLKRLPDLSNLKKFQRVCIVKMEEPYRDSIWEADEWTGVDESEEWKEWE